MLSILDDDEDYCCYICHYNYGIEMHHIFFGTAHRKISDKNRFVVHLCQSHHRGYYGVHGTKGDKLNLQLKQTCQKKYEETHTREEFIKLIGKSYL